MSERSWSTFVPILPQTVFFVANWAKISLESVLSVTEGVSWLSFDKMTNRHGNLWLKGLWLKAIFLVVVITIAHRVPTVIDSDKVRVLSYGKLFYVPVIYVSITFQSNKSKRVFY